MNLLGAHENEPFGIYEKKSFLDSSKILFKKIFCEKSLNENKKNEWAVVRVKYY